jgi:hypothetical protein
MVWDERIDNVFFASYVDDYFFLVGKLKFLKNEKNLVT